MRTVPSTDPVERRSEAPPHRPSRRERRIADLVHERQVAERLAIDQASWRRRRAGGFLSPATRLEGPSFPNRRSWGENPPASISIIWPGTIDSSSLEIGLRASTLPLSMPPEQEYAQRKPAQSAAAATSPSGGGSRAAAAARPRLRRLWPEPALLIARLRRASD